MVSHRCKEMAAWCWAVTTVKRRNEGSGSMSRQVRRGFFFLVSPLSDEGCAGAQHTGEGYRGSPESTHHISSQSHLVDRGSLTQSLRVPEEPVDSSSTAQASLLSTVCNRCHRLLFLSVVMHHPRNFSPVCFFILLTVLKELWKEEMLTRCL